MKINYVKENLSVQPTFVKTYQSSLRFSFVYSQVSTSNDLSVNDYGFWMGPTACITYNEYSSTI